MNTITGQVMYLGPTIRGAGLTYSKIWRDGVDDPNVANVIALCPAVAELFIPVAQIGVVLRELNFDYAHNMKGTTGRYVTLYSAIQQWLAQPKEEKPATRKKQSYA